MKGRTIFIWCLLAAVIVTYLIVKTLVKDYNIGKIQPVDEMSEIVTSIVKGADIPRDYNNNYNGIKNNSVDFSIVGKNNSPIPFNNEEELRSILYNLTDYYRIEYTYEGITYIVYSINDYDLLERNVTSKASYNKELLAKYLGVDPSELKSNVEKPRDLLEGEVYGKTVIQTFENRKAQFEDGTLYFIVNDENIHTLDDLKMKVQDNEIFKKEYQTDSESKIQGYTFTKALD